VLREAWTLAIETLSWMEMRRLSEPLALARTVHQLGMTDKDVVRLAHLLVSETVRRKNFVDRFIGLVMSPVSFYDLDYGTQSFLRLFVYQTRCAKGWMTIDFDEAVNVVRLGRSILGWKTLAPVEPFLGLLLTRHPDSVLNDVSDEQRIGLETFHPSWYVKYCFNVFGRQEAVDLLGADVKAAPTFVRLNTLKAEEKEILERVRGEGVCIEKVKGLRFTYEVVAGSQPVVGSSVSREGLVFVQDKASCFAVEAGGVTPGLTVFDVCAAPGAKTGFLAQLLQNKGLILSVDYSKRRMVTWKSQVELSGVKIAEPILADARFSLPVRLKCDLLLLDPPCTGTGTFARNPAGKWRVLPRSIDKMAEVQWRMLDNCAKYVKSGGVLVYSTCSVTVEENEMLIERFLKRHSEYMLIEIMPDLGLPGLRGLWKSRRLYPHMHGCNGFFIAKMQKSEDWEEA
jgi:16S rRNA (cytosine967-C5)-methyltransferase